jgi:hypothetical protein
MPLDSVPFADSACLRLASLNADPTPLAPHRTHQKKNPPVRRTVYHFHNNSGSWFSRLSISLFYFTLVVDWIGLDTYIDALDFGRTDSDSSLFLVYIFLPHFSLSKTSPFFHSGRRHLHPYPPSFPPLHIPTTPHCTIFTCHILLHCTHPRTTHAWIHHIDIPYRHMIQLG